MRRDGSRRCGLIVRLDVSDIHVGDSTRLRTTIVQQKTGRLVPFKMTNRHGTRSRLGSVSVSCEGTTGSSPAGVAQAIT